MDKNLPQNNSTIFDRLPIAIGQAAIDACLASFPLQLLALNFVKNMGSEFISIRNEKQINKILNSLNEKICILENNQLLVKNTLVNNLAYQEVANKRLSGVSALDSTEDLELSAKIIALCSLTTGVNPKDKFILRALGEITPDELRLFQLLHLKIKQWDERKFVFTQDEKRDQQNYENLEEAIALEFFDEGEKLLNLFNFTHLLSHLHSFGLIEAVKSSAFFSYRTKPKVYPPQLTEIGEYLITKFEEVGIN